MSKDTRAIILERKYGKGAIYSDAFTEDRIISWEAFSDRYNDGDSFDVIFMKEGDLEKLDERSNDYFNNKFEYCDYEVAFEHAWENILSQTEFEYAHLNIYNPRRCVYDCK